MVAERIKEKLSAVPAKVTVTDQITDGAGPPIDHEVPLYAAIDAAFYRVVNECAKHLEYPLMYTQNHGTICASALLAPCCCSAVFALSLMLVSNQAWILDVMQCIWSWSLPNLSKILCYAQAVTGPH